MHYIRIDHRRRGKITMSQYRNVFLELGFTEEEIEARLKEIVHTFFFDEENRVYFETSKDLAYIEDVRNNDARTEGMSYGMMMCVQLDMKEEFDKIWNWAHTYMYMSHGINVRYFAWSCTTDGKKNSHGPAPDGEEYFAMALFFASHRWGDGEGIYDYSHEAKELLKTCIHKGEHRSLGKPMWNAKNHQILFIPGCKFTDPSYHLPHFYKLFSQWAYEEDRDFWKKAEKASRELLAKACHPVTGLNPEYSEFDGSPVTKLFPHGRHDWFYSDAYRTVANIGLDYAWNQIDVGQRAAAERQQYFLGVVNKENPYKTYEVDGTVVSDEVLHPLGLLATTAQGALAIPEALNSDELSETGQIAKDWVLKFWKAPMRTGVKRYYDNCLYMFAFLSLSGRYRIW